MNKKFILKKALQNVYFKSEKQMRPKKNHFSILIHSLFSIILFNLLGCSGLIGKIQQQISNEEAVQSKNSLPQNNSPFGKLKTSRNDKKPIKDPITFSVNGDENIQDQAQENTVYKKRLKVSDFVDSRPAASLWDNYDDSSSFFSTSNYRKRGELIVIDVMDSLRKNISRELRKTFPLNSFFAQGANANPENDLVMNKNANTAPDKSTADSINPNRQPGASAGPEKADDEIAEIVYDKISTRISDIIDDQHVILKGRKEVFFRNTKRLVEIHALVKKADIDSKEIVKSENLIESRVFIIKN